MKYDFSGSAWRLFARAAAGVLVSLLVVNPGFGQSSVQLYGQVDEYIGAQSTPSGNRAWKVGDGGASTSYWGLKGVEDLGNSFKAIFTLEDFFRASNGRYGSFDGDTFFSRNAYVGIESPYGTVTAGRLTTQLFISTIIFNPFEDSYTFSPMVYHVFLGLGNFPNFTTDQGAVGPGDWNNAVQYSSPRFGGLSASFMYALGNTAGDNAAKKWSGQFLYFSNGLSATGVVQYLNFNSTVGDLTQLVSGLKSQTVGQLGLTYDFRVAKLFAQYMYTYNDQQSGSWRVNTVQGGVTIPVGIGAIKASYVYSRDGGGLDQLRKTWALGYDYPLSKRTDVYATYLNDHINGQSTGQTYGVGIREKF